MRSTPKQRADARARLSSASQADEHLAGQLDVARPAGRARSRSGRAASPRFGRAITGSTSRPGPSPARRAGARSAEPPSARAGRTSTSARCPRTRSRGDVGVVRARTPARAMPPIEWPTRTTSRRSRRLEHACARRRRGSRPSARSSRMVDSPWPRWSNAMHAEPELGQRLELLHPDPDRERDAVATSTIGGPLPRLMRVDRCRRRGSGGAGSRRTRGCERLAGVRVGRRRRLRRRRRARPRTPRRRHPATTAAADAEHRVAAIELMPTRIGSRTPRDPAADAAHDLVGDGAEPLGPLVGGDLVVALPAEQHDLVADLDRRRRRRRPSAGPS